MDDFEKIGASVLLGAALAYVPRFIANKQKLNAHGELLRVEIKTCMEMAQTYIDDNFKSPAYRLPSSGWSVSVPQILGVTSINNIRDIQYYYLEVDALNRGLNLAEKYIDDDSKLTREYNRNLIKSRNITIKRYEKAKQAAEKITRWPWLC